MQNSDSEDSLIFVSIAAYRDPQLVPTVLDCLRKAAYPELLRFGICWQRGPEEAPLPFADDPRFRILEVAWHESRGACWARAEVMKLWQGEDWFLQVDSHCRFTRDWDTRLLQSTIATRSDKPILTTYASPFTPDEQGNFDEEVLGGEPLMIAYQGFTADGLPKLRPADFPRGQQMYQPVRARFVSAGFLFAPGFFVEEVPYDPELYFMGEEAAMTVRAFTHGYDLFHPVQVIVWHDYLRLNARRHWGDHDDTSVAQKQVVRRWSDLDASSRSKVQRLLAGEPVGSFGLGAERTIADYEAYAGISFALRKAQLATVRSLQPPNPAPPEDWVARIQPWIAKIVVQRAKLPSGALDNPRFWYLGILDGEGYEITRIDLQPEQLAPLAGEQEELIIVCEFESEAAPAGWTLWPLSGSGGWLDKIEGRLGADDFAIVDEGGEE